MKKEDEDADSINLSAMEEKTKKREHKKRREMDVSGKSVFKIKELKDKREGLTGSEEST